MLDVWVLSDVALDYFEVEILSRDEWGRLAGPVWRVLAEGVVPERRGRKALFASLAVLSAVCFFNSALSTRRRD